MSDVFYVFKVIVIGPGAVGKTSIINRFVKDEFVLKYKLTIGTDFLTKTFEYKPNKKAKLQIWDIGGQAFHMSPYRDKFYQGAQMAMLLVDRTRKKTLENAEMWFKDSLKSISNQIPFILIGNKSDLTEEIIVSEQAIKSEAEKLNLNYFLTSAKTGENINDAFYELTKLYFESSN